MHFSNSALLPTTIFCLLGSVLGRSSTQRPPGRDAILLSDMQALTLRANKLTASRRVPPIPQLKCTGPSQICDLYTIDTMRCVNSGYDYDVEDIQWTCTAQLPAEVKLGSTDVICEGYRGPDDKWVLKGSCGVEYRLFLTELGEQRFGKLTDDRWTSWRRGSPFSYNGWRKLLTKVGDLVLFWSIVAVFVLISLPMVRNCFGMRQNRRERPSRGGWGGWGWPGGGGGGGGGGGPGYGRGNGDSYSCPPPPYSCSEQTGPSTQAWTPGFWTGLLGGAAAGYQFARHRRDYGDPYRAPRPTPSYSRYNDYDPCEGSSRSRSPPTFSSTRTSTGFGSTRRR